jgi:hypothetical protein
MNFNAYSNDLFLFLCPDFDLHPGYEPADIYLVFSTCISRPTSLLASSNVSEFFMYYASYLPVGSHHQYKPEADMSHSISVSHGFPGPEKQR